MAQNRQDSLRRRRCAFPRETPGVSHREQVTAPQYKLIFSLDLLQSDQNLNYAISFFQRLKGLAHDSADHLAPIGSLGPHAQASKTSPASLPERWVHSL